MAGFHEAQEFTQQLSDVNDSPRKTDASDWVSLGWKSKKVKNLYVWQWWRTDSDFTVTMTTVNDCKLKRSVKEKSKMIPSIDSYIDSSERIMSSPRRCNSRWWSLQSFVCVCVSRSSLSSRVHQLWRWPFACFQWTRERIARGEEKAI